MKFWVILILLVLLFFGKAFSVGFIMDDFSHLELAKNHSILQFFIPGSNGTFYRPIPTELFYLLITKTNIFIAHGVVFIFFILSLLVLDKVIFLLSKDEKLSKLTVLLYALSFTHVFQLYWLATFQEICLLLFSLAATYFFLKKRTLLFAVCFVLALLSKEQAVMLPLLLILLNRKNVSAIFISILLSVIFVLSIKLSLSHVITIPEYQVLLSPRLILNNLMWYFLWSLGLPSVLPDFIPGLFKPPLPFFYTFFKDSDFKLYVFSLIAYLVIIFGAALKSRNLKITLFCLLGFLIFILPVLPITHRWMVRLTLPLIFISVFEAHAISKLPKHLALILICLYVFWNFWGTRFHEKASTYFFETEIVKQVQLKASGDKDIFFADSGTLTTGWEGSKKLKLTLAGQAFLKHLFPNQNIKAVYGFEKSSPRNAQILDAQKIVESASKNVH